MPRFLQDPDIFDIIALCILLFSWFVAIPCIASKLYVFIHMHSQNEIAKMLISERDPPSLLIFNILCLFEALLNRPFVLCTTVFFDSIHIPSWLIVLIYSIFWIAMLTLYALRTWKLNYKQQLNIALSAKLWETKINKNIENWYVKNQHKNNNWYLFKILFPFYLLLISIGPILQAFAVNNSIFVHIFNFLWMLLPLIIGLIIFYKSNKIIDRFGIRNEFKFETIILIIILTIYTTEFIIFNSGILINNNDDDIVYIMTLIRIEYILYSLNATLLNFVLALISTVYPSHLVKQIISNDRYTKVGINTKSTNSNTFIDYEEDAMLALIDVLSDEMKFRLFMSHLITEFATESLLFITELVQCKYIYSNILNNGQQSVTTQLFALSNGQESVKCSFGDDVSHPNNTSITVILPSALVLSDILVNNDGHFKHLTLYQALNGIYTKYIKNGALYEINISGEMRNKLNDIFINNNNYNTDTTESQILLNVYDEAAIDILWTLQDAMHRFNETNTFQCL